MKKLYLALMLLFGMGASLNISAMAPKEVSLPVDAQKITSIFSPIINNPESVKNLMLLLHSRSRLMETFYAKLAHEKNFINVQDTEEKAIYVQAYNKAIMRLLSSIESVTNELDEETATVLKNFDNAFKNTQALTYQKIEPLLLLYKEGSEQWRNYVGSLKQLSIFSNKLFHEWKNSGKVATDQFYKAFFPFIANVNKLLSAQIVNDLFAVFTQEESTFISNSKVFITAYRFLNALETTFIELAEMFDRVEKPSGMNKFQKALYNQVFHLRNLLYTQTLKNDQLKQIFKFTENNAPNLESYLLEKYFEDSSVYTKSIVIAHNYLANIFISFENAKHLMSADMYIALSRLPFFYHGCRKANQAELQKSFSKLIEFYNIFNYFISFDRNIENTSIFFESELKDALSEAMKEVGLQVKAVKAAQASGNQQLIEKETKKLEQLKEKATAKATMAKNAAKNFPKVIEPLYTQSELFERFKQLAQEFFSNSNLLLKLGNFLPGELTAHYSELSSCIQNLFVNIFGSEEQAINFFERNQIANNKSFINYLLKVYEAITGKEYLHFKLLEFKTEVDEKLVKTVLTLIENYINPEEEVTADVNNNNSVGTITVDAFKTEVALPKVQKKKTKKLTMSLGAFMSAYEQANQTLVPVVIPIYQSDELVVLRNQRGYSSFETMTLSLYPVRSLDAYMEEADIFIDSAALPKMFDTPDKRWDRYHAFSEMIDNYLHSCAVMVEPASALAQQLGLDLKEHQYALAIQAKISHAHISPEQALAFKNSAKYGVPGYIVYIIDKNNQRCIHRFFHLLS